MMIVQFYWFFKNPYFFHHGPESLQSQQGLPVFTSIAACVSSCLSDGDILTAVRCCPIMVLICISLVMGDVQHLFLGLLASSKFLENCLFRSFAYFLIRLLGFSVWQEFLHFLDTRRCDTCMQQEYYLAIKDEILPFLK